MVQNDFEAHFITKYPKDMHYIICYVIKIRRTIQYKKGFSRKIFRPIIISIKILGEKIMQSKNYITL